MKRAFSFFFAAVLAVLMCVSSYALTLDAAEEDTAVLSEENLIVPGINAFTGTEAFKDFEAEGESFPGKDGFKTFEITTETAVSGTHSAKGVGGATYPKIYSNVNTEPGRKYFVHISIMSDSSTTTEYALWLMQKNCKGETGNHVFKDYSSGFKTNSLEGKWYTVSDVVTATTNEPFYIQNKGNGTVFYYDDLAIVPFYKITYVGLDGETVVATDYALVDSNGDVMEFYIPDLTKVEGATGYALTKGGERITEVALTGNKDIVLYAIDDAVVSLAYGDAYENFAVEGESFTFPSAEETFEGITNFFVYSDGVNYYKAGEKAAASDVIGKTFTAICTTYKTFDPVYGELIMLTDYELKGVHTATGSTTAGTVVPSYVNRDYVTGNIEHTDGNCVMSYAVTDVDGNRVLKLRTNTKNVYNYWLVLLNSVAPGKYTAFETAKAESTQADVPISASFKGGWHRFTFGSYKATTVAGPTEEWTTQNVSYVSAAGLTGSGFSYNRADKTYTPNIYKDDHAVYLYPSYAVYFQSEKDADGFAKVAVDSTATTFTFPVPADIDMEIANFAAWTNGTKYFKSGETVALADVQYTAFYPFCQSVEEPAMGFTFEGERKASAVEVGGPVYTENVMDEGRDVLHIHTWNGKHGEGESFPTDQRLTFRTTGYSNPAEYNIIVYCTKVAEAWDVVKDGNNVVRDENGNAKYTAATTKYARIFAHTTAGGVYTNPVINLANITVNVSDDYKIYEIEGSKNAKFVELGGYGFCVDPFQSSFGSEAYIDYLRVYRWGVQTINYDTNAPEGATVVKSASADKNRGIGYGYLLKDERPEVEGYTFLGWALTPDSDETVTSITVDGDETVYAVWAKAETTESPEMADVAEIRGNGEANGIRFKSEISPAVKASLSEFGFLATREVLLPFADEEKTARDYTALTFLHKVKGSGANYFVQGVAYDADGGIDVINKETEDGNIVYTTVLSGIPMEKKAEKMVVRPYAKYIVNGKEAVVYGNASSASLYETALAIKTENGAAYASNKEYVDSILAE